MSRAAARWTGLGLLVVMVVGLVQDSIAAAASAAYVDGYGEGYHRAQADLLERLNTVGPEGAPGPPGSPGPSGP